MVSIIESGGKQYLVKPGVTIQVEKLIAEVGSEIKFDKVLFSGDAKSYQIGKPTLSGVAVTGKVIKQSRSRKVHVLKYKAKSKYRRKQGHRQHYTEVEITKV